MPLIFARCDPHDFGENGLLKEQKYCTGSVCIRQTGGMPWIEGCDEGKGESGQKQEGGKRNKNSEVESPGDHNVGKRPPPRDQGGQAEGRLPRWSVSPISSRFLAVPRHLYTRIRTHLHVEYATNGGWAKRL